MRVSASGAVGRLHGPLLFARSRGGALLIPLVVVIAGLGVAASPSPVAVPVRTDGVAFLVPLASAVGAVCAPAVLSRPDPAVELPVGRLVRARVVWWVVVLMSLSLSGLLLPLPLHGLALTVRNTATVLGITTLVGVVLSRSFAWIPGLILIGLTWLYGWSPDGRPLAWALLAHPVTSPVSLSAAVLLGAAGVTAYARCDQHS